MRKYLKTIAFFGLAAALSSCLKDKPFDDAETGLNIANSSKLIQLGGANAPGRSETVGLSFDDKVVTPIVVRARLLTETPAPTDIVITLDTTGQSVQFPAGVVKLPNSFYTLPKGLTITIPAGQNEGTLEIRTNSIQFDPSTTYGLAFKIGNISPGGYAIAQNFNTFYTLLSAKNKYDGNYELTINTSGWAAFGISDGVTRVWPSNSDKTSIFMITKSGNTVDMFDDYGFGTFIQVAFTSTGGATGFGATSPRFIFDNTTNKLTDVVNTTPPDARNRVFMLNPSAPANTNYFDPATHNIFANYILKQTGRPDQSIVATFKYVGPRP